MRTSAQTLLRVVVVTAFCTVAGCGQESSTPVTPASVPQTTSPPPAPPAPAPPPIVSDATVIALGDIAMCASLEPEATAKLVDGIPGTVLALGDIAYPKGSREDFARCYEPSWGRHRSRTRPAPGNHDYETPGAAGYYEYFGANAGPSGRGYYHFREGEWLILSLNSNVPAGAGSPQAEWLRSILAQETARCTLAYWHHPLFTSGPNGGSSHMREAWDMLQAAGAEVVLVGHDHLYERFAPQNSRGRADAAGMRQFTVGTGGADLYKPRTRQPNSEALGVSQGVLKVRLKADGYEWQFVPVAGESFQDSGSGPCR